MFSLEEHKRLSVDLLMSECTSRHKPDLRERASCGCQGTAVLPFSFLADMKMFLDVDRRSRFAESG